MKSVESNGFHFMNMNADPKITEICRCITTRQHSGISKHKGENFAFWTVCLQDIRLFFR